MTKIESYISNKILPGFLVRFGSSRSDFDAELRRQQRCLTPVGISFFRAATYGYLASRRSEADELVVKSCEFLTLADNLHEKQKYNYIRNFSEGMRSATLAYVRWLDQGTMQKELLDVAAEEIRLYVSRMKSLPPAEIRALTPVLLFSEAYPLILNIADRLSSPAKGSPRSPTGLFAQAVKIAAAEEKKREDEKLKAMKRMPKYLFSYIDNGLFDSLAFTIYSLSPKPRGRPSLLIENAWALIPENLLPGGG